MSVSIIWSSTNGGSSLSSTVDHGENLMNGDTSTVQEIFVRHDGGSEINSCGLFVREFTGTYTGRRTAATDLLELLEWGDGATASTFGGVQFNLDATGSYSSSSWPTYDGKSPSNGGVCRTGTGDSEDTAITLTTTTGATADGVIQSGSSPNVRFQMRIEVPSSEDETGIRQFEVVLTYSETS